MSDHVIAVEGLGKKYLLRHQQGERHYGYTTLRDKLTETVKGIFSKGSTFNVQRSTTSEEFWALQDVSFEVKQGESIGIIGRNGAGKSTLLKILSRIVEPTRGRVHLKGRVASLLEVGTGFHPELTGRENVYLNGAILGMGRVEIAKKFDEIVAFAEVEKFLDTPVKRYSSGMYMRLAFAVAAHLEPEILVVDEVLAVGDAAFQKKCLDKMQDVGRQGRTVLFVSHNMTAVRSLCDRAILLRAGSVVADGGTESVTDSYLRTESSNVLRQRWDDPETAPGNDWVRIRNIELIPDLSDPVAPIDVRTSLKIRCEFSSQLKEATLNLSLHLFTMSGNCVFAVGSNAEQGGVGNLVGECHIPGDFLNDGTFKINMMIVKDGSTAIYTLEDALVFEVKDYRESTAWHGKWPGAVRPRFIPFSLRKLDAKMAGISPERKP